MLSKNPNFTFENVVRVAYRSLIKKIDSDTEDKLVYIINYLMDSFWGNEIDDFLHDGTIVKT